MKPKIVIRRMQETDLERVAEIEAENFSTPWSREGFAEALKKAENLYLAALDGERVIGYCGYYRSFEEAEIVNVSVAKERQAEGVGLKLLTALLEGGKKAGVTTFFLEVREHNTAAIALYRRLEFVQISVRKNFYEAPREDALIYRKQFPVGVTG